jgi:hypothetical protein
MARDVERTLAVREPDAVLAVVNPEPLPQDPSVLHYECGC